MKRKLSAAIIIFLLIAILAGCNSIDPNDDVVKPVHQDVEKVDRTIGFVMIAKSEGGYYTVFREKLTGYMYIAYNSMGNATGTYIDGLTGLAPLYDPEDGRPLSWEKYQNLISN
ncbi:hypothetical protein FWF89_00750 [Candidatus Saccharibacteria bacterium]|nr:hypothetical protein [Candidatus Saccharibacteria bacterium]